MSPFQICTSTALSPSLKTLVKAFRITSLQTITLTRTVDSKLQLILIDSGLFICAKSYYTVNDDIRTLIKHLAVCLSADNGHVSVFYALIR